MRRSDTPPRHPPLGAWPAVMRADMVAAYLDYQSVAELIRAVGCGEAPSPTGFRGTGRARQPVWAKAALDTHGNGNRSSSEDEPKRDLAALV
jgi:hypothetical protein